MLILADMRATSRIRQIERQINGLKRRLLALGDMRPGSLSRQFNVCGKPNCRCKDPRRPRRHGPYWKLSYVHGGHFTSAFIRRQHLAQVRRQLANYKRFRRLTTRWVGLALELAKLQLRAAA
jgi:hypothetical protein